MTDPAACASAKSLHELRDLVVRRKGELTKSAEKVARFAFAYPDDVAFYSAAGLADVCGVSAATVRRLVAFLGFRSHRDFRELFREQLRQRRSRSLVPMGRPTRAAAGALPASDRDVGGVPLIHQRSDPHQPNPQNRLQTGA